MLYTKQWDFLKNKFDAGQLGHAYIFSGRDADAKIMFAKQVATLISANTAAASDALIEKEQFPDLLVVRSRNSKSSVDNAKDMMEIDVAQIRQVNTFLSYTSYYGGYKTVIIEDAERLNQEAQSCFLKTLEEPKGKTVVILLVKSPELLLPTISSRCQTISFSALGKYQESKEDQQLLQELLPILPAELATKFQYTKKVNLEGENFSLMLKVLQQYFRNMLLIKIGIHNSNLQTYSSAANYSVEKLKKIIRLIEILYKQTTTTNASPKLALEILLMEM